MGRPSKPALTPLLRQWQRKLHLLDWDITVEYVQQWEEGKEILGNCLCNCNKGIAHIRILDPAKSPHDPLHTLVHELLHVKLWDIVRDSEHILPLEERFIEHLVPLLCKR